MDKEWGEILKDQIIPLLKNRESFDRDDLISAKKIVEVMESKNLGRRERNEKNYSFGDLT
jgi:hypothetical protein